MGKKRVYQVARELNLSSEALLRILQEMKVAVKSHMSSIDEDVISAIKVKLSEEKEAVKREAERKKQIAEEAEVKLKIEEKVVEPPRKPILRRRISDERSVKETVRRTLAEIEGVGRPRRRRRRERAEGEALEIEVKRIKITEFASVGEVANALGVKPSEVIACCLRLGIIATVNQGLDADTIEMVADEFGYEVEFEKEYGADLAEVIEAEPEPRHPVVTIMGHVDHGKTSLLDYIRRSNIVAGEAGGITQHIGAYEVETPMGKITFLDTPGHEAFTAMRARGAQITDIVVLVVAADERVMPQTVEAIDHARAAEVPIIVAINKIDLPTANIDRIKQDLANHGLIPDEWGGNTVMVPVSAKTGEGIDHLLEVILLQAEEMNLRAPRKGRASGVVIESKVEQGRGIVITVLVEKGELKVGDPFVAGVWNGRVRAMFNERRKRVETASPSSPVEVLGCQGVPQAGDSFIVTSDEHESKKIAAKRQILQREREIRRARHVTLEDLRRRVDAGEIKELRIVAKADVDGSLEALGDVLQRLSREDVGIKIIHKGVGAINESDVLLAAASDAVIIGFHVGISAKAREIAVRENVDVRTYKIIYELTRDIESAMDGLLGPAIEEKVIGVAEVRRVFDIGGVGRVAGCYIKDGKVARDCIVRVLRDQELIYEGRIASLKRFKDDVKEVSQGFECGIGIDGFEDVEEGDVLEFVVIEEVPRA